MSNITSFDPGSRSGVESRILVTSSSFLPALFKNGSVELYLIAFEIHLGDEAILFSAHLEMDVCW